MKFIRYGKYVGEPADAVDLEELIKRLGDFFLQSGFESQFYGVSQMDPERSMEALREAILRALQEGDLLPEDAMGEELRKMLQDPAAMNSSDRSAAAALAGTTRGIWPRVSNPAASRAPMNSATRSTWTSAPRCLTPFAAKAQKSPSK